MAFLSSASKATKITLGVVAGAVFLIGVVPYIITWNQYKSVITDKVAQQLGREMQINGNIRFSILPRPEAHVSKIVIKNPTGSSAENFVQVEQLDVAVALLPLLHKQVDIEKITLVKPAITLEKMANGGNNWTFTPSEKEKAEDNKDPTEADASTALKINDIELSDAYIRYIDDASKSVQTVGPINANLNLESLQGPYGAKGDLAYNKATIQFDAVIGAADTETKTQPINANIFIGGKDVVSTFKGQLKRAETTSVSGALAMQANDLANVLNAIAPANDKNAKKTELPKSLNSFALQSQILYSANKIALPNLQIKGDGLDVLADTVVTTGERTNVTMDISRFAVPAALTGGDATAGSADTKDKTNEPLAETLRNAFNSAQSLLNIAFPTAPLDIIISADNLILPGKPPVRDMRLAASSDTNQFTLQSLQAKLNGNTRVSVTAKAPLNAQKKPEQLVANIALSSDNLAAALSNEATQAKADPLSVNATTTLNRQALKIEPLQVTQQGQTLNGSIVYQPDAAMPLVLALRGGVLNLDNLTGKKDGDTAKTETATTAGPDKAGSSVLNRLKGFKAQFDVAIDRVITGGKNFSNVLAKGTFSEAGLNLQQASANLSGLALGANGTIGKLSPLGDMNLTVQGNTNNLSDTLKALGNENARNLGATNFGGTVKGDLAKIALNIDAKLDQGAGKIKGDVLGLDKGQTGFDGTVALNHPDTATIMRNFAKMNPAQALGPFALDATIKYAGDTIKADNFTVKLGSAGTVKGSVNVTPNGQQKNIDANITADKLNLAAMMGDQTAAANGTATPSNTNANAGTASDGWSREPVNLDAIRNLNGKATVKIGELLYKDFVIRNFNNDLAFTNGALKLNDLSADLFDAGRMVVNGTLDPAPVGQAHKGQFNLTIKDTDAAKFFNALDSQLFAKGTFSAQQQLNFAGSSPYQIINALNGDGQFKLRDAVVNGLDLDALAAKMDRPNSVGDFTALLQQAKAGGQTTIGDVDVPISIRNGIANIAQTTVKTQLTQTTFGGTADLPSKTVNMGGQIVFTEQKNMPPLGMRLTGPFSAPQKNFDTASIGQFFLQKATAKYQDKAAEKLDKLVGDKVPGLGNLLGLPSKTPAATPEAAPAAESSTPAPAAPAASEPASSTPAPAESTPAPAPTQPTQKQSQKQQLEKVGGQLLQGLLGGQQ